MRHAILATHFGERITPAQLKAELLEKFPSVKPQSVNAPDCFYSDRKRAGSGMWEARRVRGEQRWDRGHGCNVDHGFQAADRSQLARAESSASDRIAFA